ncbi:MAG TPA: hypothetical protein VMS77_09440 [Conexivisphaerales archaeon]|nr:hypothetical protein [Conexivisphaerales archaeon]
MPSYHLTDVEARHRENPSTFVIPDLTSRQSLRPGDWAKVIVDDRERLWVLITEAACYHYRATVLQVPVIVDLKKDDIIELHPEHVADIVWSSSKPYAN